MILLVDNYDSFSYNLYQLIGSFNTNIKVIRNDEMTVEEIKRLLPERIVLSPGPGKPSEAGVCKDIVKHLGRNQPILGVCLGHQAICETFGGMVVYAKSLMHGKTSEVTVDTEDPLFKRLPSIIQAARYHSLAVSGHNLPKELIVTAKTSDGEVMAVRHRSYQVYGIQFHPESILTPDGRIIIENFLRI